MKRIICAMLAMLTVSAEAANKIEVQGHRGARARFPENTIPAFEHALAVGVDTLELDLSVTADNVLVVSHDPLINPKICLGPDQSPIKSQIPIRRLTLEQLKAFDCGTLKNPEFEKQVPVPGTRIPTLEEVFIHVRDSKHKGADKVGFNIETKSFPNYPELTPAPEEFSKLILTLVKKYNLQKRVTIQSFDHRTLEALKKLKPRVEKAVLSPSGIFPNFLLMAKDLKAKIISPHKEWINAEVVEELDEHKIRVIPWTSNDPAEWDKLIEMKVHGIITDDPEALIKHLKAKGLR